MALSDWAALVLARIFWSRCDQLDGGVAAGLMGNKLPLAVITERTGKPLPRAGVIPAGSHPRL
jgi:hypothetical protein